MAHFIRTIKIYGTYISSQPVKKKIRHLNNIIYTFTYGLHFEANCVKTNYKETLIIYLALFYFVLDTKLLSISISSNS